MMSRSEASSEAAETSKSPRRTRPADPVEVMDIASRKKRLTLDLPQLIPMPNMKTPVGLSPGGAAALLSSPDVLKLQISSPELERLILQNWIQKSPQKSPGSAPGVPMSEEQQHMYAKGFVDAISSVHSGYVQGVLGGPPSPYGYSLPMSAPYLMALSSAPAPAHSQTDNNKLHLGPNQSSILPAHMAPSLSLNGGSLQLPLMPQIVLSPISPTSIIPPSAPAASPSRRQVSRGRRRSKAPLHADEPLSYSPSASLSPSMSDGQRVPSRPASSSSGTALQTAAVTSGSDADMGDAVSEKGYDIHMDSDEERSQRKARKRERNRLAAARCRQRKLERIDELSGVAEKVREGNEALEQEAHSLRRQITAMKKTVAMHVQSGCELSMSESLRRSVERILASSSELDVNVVD